MHRGGERFTWRLEQLGQPQERQQVHRLQERRLALQQAQHQQELELELQQVLEQQQAQGRLEQRLLLFYRKQTKQQQR